MGRLFKQGSVQTIVFASLLVVSGLSCRPNLLGGTDEVGSDTGDDVDSGFSIPTDPWFAQIGATSKVSGLASANADLEECYSVAVDSVGNSYCVGHSEGNLGEVNANPGTRDAVVIKFNAAGEMEWIVQFGDTTKKAALANANESGDVFYSVAVDAQGYVYAAGNTSGNFAELAGGGGDAMVVKLSPDGVVQWMTQLGASTTKAAVASANQGGESVSGVAVHTDGTVYICGQTGGNVGEVNANPGSNDIFVAKLHADGTLDWATQLGATTQVAVASANMGLDFCSGVALDSSGNAYLSGSTYGNVGEVNGGSADVLVVKVSASGAFQWATQLGASTQKAGVTNANQLTDVCNSIAVSGTSVYCAGATSGALGEDNGSAADDAFVMKLSLSSGALQWITQLGATTVVSGLTSPNQASDQFSGLTVGPSGAITAAGYTFGEFGEASGGSADAMVAQFDSSGNIEWVTQLGAVNFKAGLASANAGFDQCRDVAVDNVGNVYCGGRTSGAVGETSGGVYDIFMVKLTAAGQTN